MTNNVKLTNPYPMYWCYGNNKALRFYGFINFHNVVECLSICFYLTYKNIKEILCNVSPKSQVNFTTENVLK